MTELTDWIPRSLRTAIEAGRCVPFVGSGLSIPHGYPTWSELLNHLADVCRAERKPNPDVIRALVQGEECLLAAQRALDRLGPASFRNAIVDRFRAARPQLPLTVHKLVWGLTRRLVMTTNWDTLLEDSLTTRPQVVTSGQQPEILDVFRRQDDAGKVLFKVHGTINDFQTIVFTSEQYRTTYARDELRARARHWAFVNPLLADTVLFIGFGMSDPGVLQMLRATSEAFNNFAGTHYALLQRNDHLAKELWDHFKIQVIPYEDHGQLPALLAALQGSAAPKVQRKARRIIARPPAPSGARRQLAASKAIPQSLRRRAIGECILVLGGHRNGKVMSWKPGQIYVSIDPTFVRPDKWLVTIREETTEEYWRLGYETSPRVALVRLRVEPKQHPRYGDITIEAQLTDWALIDGIQKNLERGPSSRHHTKILNEFWKSVSSVVTERESGVFPHHLAVHCLVVSADDRVILNKRAGVSNQRGMVSASFEEQVQFPHIYASRPGHQPRHLDGDLSPADTVLRGAKEELGIDLARDELAFLGLALESRSVAANLLVFARSAMSAREIYKSWKKAEDFGENTMIPPELSPAWDVAQISSLVAEPVFGDFGPWHASSQARILLGLAHEFGVVPVTKRLHVPALEA